MNDHAAPQGPSGRPPRRALDRRGFLTAAGLTAAGAALAAVGGEAFAAARPLARPASAGGFAVPLDTVRHTRTWMAWPDSSAIWGRQLAGVQANIALIAKTIAKYEPVAMCANSASVSKAKSACGSAVTVIGSIPVDDCWMRDSGPVFRTNGAGGLDTVGLNFNGWGNQQTHAKDALVASRIAAYTGVPFSTAAFVGEGGAVETDGAGTLMATRSSIINPDRNPGLTQSQIEAAMCAAFGASKVIWFKGVLGRDITDDHVDATSRFLAPGQGLVQMPLAGDTDPWSNDARQQYQILSTSTGAQGNPVSVTKLQGPDYGLIRSTNPDFVAAYANYYVCNGAVIAPQFGDSRADAAAGSTLQRLFPGRTVEQLDIDSLGAGGGGIHCVTQQQPVP
ncbi:agmatine deiminase family protein [Streptomyces vinaceus]|uniref:Agmatine deiminase family protein n=1 Tax=Streptomyces vinaceus TaxID=1960 RepID=A0A5J6JCW5_STRVI|nr:agmatine deiminase family protein [Streptomyces vinaceus]QEV48710.1 agmatine deiminase family protein [Streptomyces vinaceus]GHE36671.1 porphyromonas-type peptidyl-arginine deiminase [Streptomyces vinaceus]